MKNNIMKNVLNYFKLENQFTSLLNIFIFTVLSGSLLQFRRDLIQIVLVFTSVFFIQVFLYFFIKENKIKTMTNALSISGYIATGILLYFKNWNPYFYAVVTITTLFVYACVKNAKLKISYNPLNLGIMLGIFLFAPSTFLLNINAFLFQTLPFLLILTLGCLLTTIRKKWLPVTGYLAAMFTYALIDYLFFYGSFSYWIAPAFGIFGLIFVFLILTDHGFDFSTKKDVFIFGLAVGVFNIILKKQEYFYSEYLAMFIVSTFINIYNVLRFSFNNNGPIVSRV